MGLKCPGQSSRQWELPLKLSFLILSGWYLTGSWNNAKVKPGSSVLLDSELRGRGEITVAAPAALLSGGGLPWPSRGVLHLSSCSICIPEQSARPEDLTGKQDFASGLFCIQFLSRSSHSFTIWAARVCSKNSLWREGHRCWEEYKQDEMTEAENANTAELRWRVCVCVCMAAIVDLADMLCARAAEQRWRCPSCTHIMKYTNPPRNKLKSSLTLHASAHMHKHSQKRADFQAGKRIKGRGNLAAFSSDMNLTILHVERGTEDSPRISWSERIKNGTQKWSIALLLEDPRRWNRAYAAEVSDNIPYRCIKETPTAQKVPTDPLFFFFPPQQQVTAATWDNWLCSGKRVVGFMLGRARCAEFQSFGRQQKARVGRSSPRICVCWLNVYCWGIATWLR